ncbi:head GIN domain-containing protein [Chitinimonas viridis]|uniref:Head GIN domain-containing protein n=1 Tax=Chitinimonas viridis TaxID=664880 RepID=A0ABT8B9L5_9NEIS|nr:head GIN domain-containing protein [Chitinimonas viridis]MDN3578472.1 head GIN domain-containing protein [Chitinimonas viridis]
MQMPAALIALALITPVLAEEVRGSGRVVEQQRPVTDFQSIRSDGVWILDVKVGPAPSVKVKADDNLQPLIETVVQNKQLHIRFKDGKQTVHLKDDSKLRIEVTVPKLTAYSHEGAGKTIFHDINSEQFSLEYEGAGLVTATGRVGKLSVQASGAGALDLDALKARDVSVSLEGVGAISVYASESLTAAVDGIGSLTYYGKPAKVSKTVSGIGSVSAGN